MKRLGRVYLENHIKRIRRCCLALLIPLVCLQGSTAQTCTGGLSSTNGDMNCSPEIVVSGIFSSNITGWTSSPPEATNYLSCLDCLDPDFNYAGPPITDCNGQDFTLSLTTNCSADVLSTTFTLYPAPSGTIDLACNGSAATLTFVPDLICPNYSYQWKDAAGNPVSGSGSTSTSYTVDPADDQLYSIMVMNNDLPASCPAFVVSEVASCCYLDVDCSALENITVQCDNDPVPAPTPALISVLRSCGNTSTTTSEVIIASGNGCANDPTVIERTYTITDDNGTPGDATDDTSLDCVQTITIGDSEGPEITHAPSDLTVEYGDGVEDSFEAWLNYHAYADASDDCGGDLMWLINTPDPAIQYGCACTGSGTVMFSAVDQCGNSTDFTAVFYVEDTTAPVIEESANTEIIQCAGDDYSNAFQAWLNNNGGAEASDACDVIWSTDPPNPQLSGGCGNTSNTVVTFVASDDCGNFATTTGRFRVVDTEVPQWTNVPEDITISCSDEVVFAEPVAVDLCSETVIDYTDVENPGSYCDGSYTITRTWTARDGCQLEAAEISQTITLIDDEGPSIAPVHPLLIGLSNYDTIAFECDNMTVFSPSDFTAVDNCDPNPQVMMMDPVISSPGCADGVTVQMQCIWIGKDVCGNNTEFNVIINIVDNTPPVITNVPDDQTIECGEDPDFNDNPPTAVDNCDDNLDVTFVDTESNVGCNFTFTRTWTFTDDCGNFATATQNFNFTDNSFPEFTFVPDDQTISCADTVMFGDAIAMDDCTDVLLTVEDMTGSGTCLTNHVRVWTATDGCGNMTTASQTITTVDDVAPAFTFVPEDETVACGDSILFGTPIAIDNCSNVDLTFEQSTGSGSCITSYTRVWTATDACGLSTTVSQTITAVDDVAPIFTFVPADETVDCGEPVVFGTPEVSDNCSEVTLIFDDETTGSGSCITSYIRTWTATDVCGLSTTASQTISTTDNVAPVFTFVPVSGILECGESAAFGVPTVGDNCGDVVLTSNDTNAVDGCTETFTRTWTATDACGLSTTVAQSFTRTDDGMPTFAAMAPDVTVSCSEVPQFEAPEVTGTCGDVEVSFEDTQVTKSGCQISYVRTWTATSVCGLVATAVQSITTVDENAPVFVNLPADATISCGDTPAFGSPSYSDLCSTNVTFVSTDEVITTGCETAYTRTWTLSDGCGNTASASQTITAIDNVAPAFDFVPESLMLGCGETGTFGDATAFDNCGNVTITFDDFDQGGSLYWGFDLTRTFTATDECGNTATATQNIWIDGDQTPPVFTSVPTTQIFDCDETVTIGDAVAADDCGDVTISFVEEQIGDDCTIGYEIIRIWTVTDEAGNTATASVTVMVIGQGALNFDYIPASIVAACDQVPDFGIPVVASKCTTGETMTYEDEMIEGDCAGSYQLRRTWTASDNCSSGSATCSQTITIQDVEAPVFAQIPEDKTVSCVDAALFGTPIAEDNCNGGVVLSFEDNTTVNGCTEIMTRTWTAADDCGNVKVAAQTITVADLEAPVFTQMPADQMVSCGDAALFGTPIAEDNCVAEVALSFEDNILVNGCTEIMTRTWTAADACGNVKVATQTITRMDQLIPDFVFVPADQTLACGETPDYVAAQVTDDCSAVTLTYEDIESAVDCSESKTILRRWTATDACGNVAMAAQTFTIPQDVIAPVFSFVPQNMNINCGEDMPEMAAVANDNCSDVTLAYSLEIVEASCAKQYIRSWIATDACGNATQATQVITESDNEAPAFVFVGNNQSVLCGDAIEFTTPEFTDNCGTASITFADETSTGNCESGQSYDVTRTWTITDQCGNAVMASQTITVLSASTNIAFTNVPASLSMSCGQSVEFGTPEYFSNCFGNVLLESSDEMITEGCMEVHTRTWTVTDDCNNSVLASQTIMLVDDVAPIYADNLSDYSVTCNESIVFGTAQVSDNCGAVSLSYEDSEMTVSCNTIYTRTWIAIDACGNESYKNQTITVEDNVAPLFDNVVEESTITCEEDVNFVTMNAVDDCSEVTVTFEDSVTNSGCVAIHTRSWTATDACGNVAVFQQVVNVEDRAAPVFLTILDQSVISCGESINFTTPEAADNCSDVNVTFEDAIVMDDCSEIHTRTWTAADACGNVAQTQEVIRVEDMEAPVFSNLIAEASTDCGETINFTPPAITDNCNMIDIAFTDEIVEMPGCQTVHSRIWVATDACGNVATAQQFISVQDNMPPVFTYVPASEVLDCSEVVEFDMPEISDNCSEVTMNFADIDIAGTTSGEYQRVRTWTASDACGNQTTASQSFTILDTEAPSVVLSTDVFVIPVAEYDRNWEPGFYAFDNCSDVEVVGPIITRESVCNGVNYTYTYTATDLAGNTVSQSYLLNVVMNVDCNGNVVGEQEGFDLEELVIEGAAQTALVSDLSLSPNPTSDVLVVKFLSNTNNIDAEITLYNMLGQREHTYKHSTVNGLNKLPIRVDHLPKGNYYVRLRAGDYIMTQQVMITP